MDAETETSGTVSQLLNALFISLLSAASLLPLLAAFRHHTHLNDDTYITLTYARNLAIGHGFVFNHGPPTLGTTTPLLTLMVALLARIVPSVEVHVVAVFLTALCWLGAAWIPFLFRRTWQLSAWQAALLGLGIVGTGWISFLGMEVYLFAFLLLLSVSLFYARRLFLAGLAAGLLFLTRGEGVLLWMLLGSVSLVIIWRRGGRFRAGALREPLLLSLGFALPVSLWFAYALLTFGTVVPNTLSAKQAQGALASGRPFLERLLQEWMPSWGRGFVLGQWPYVNLWWLLTVVGIAYAVVCKSMRRWLMLLAWIGLYVAGYALLGVSAYWWYQLPIVFVAHVFVGLGLIAIVELGLTRVPTSSLRVAVVVAVAAVAVIGLLRPLYVGIRAYEGDPRAAGYLAVSQWLRENTQPTDSVAFIEIGYLGYYTDNRIVDLAGLVLPDIVPHVKDGDFAWGFWHYEPDYYIHQPAFDAALGEIARDPRFSERYEPVAAIPGHLDADYTIYRHTASDQQP